MAEYSSLADFDALPAGATLGALYPADGSTAAAGSAGVAHLTPGARQVRVFDVAP